MNNPMLARDLFHQALEAQEAGRLAEAEERLRQALIHAPGRESLLINLSGVLLARKKPVEAIALCEQAIAANSANAVAWLNLALARAQANQIEAALESIDRAIALDPGNASVHGNRGTLLMQQGCAAEALQAYSCAAGLEPACAEWVTGQGSALRALRRFDEAAAAHARAIALDPECASAHWNLALVDLTQGRYAEGWKGSEWRWKIQDAVEPRYHGEAPRWDGITPLHGRRVLLWAEQGLGDTLQFSRFARELLAQGAAVCLQVQPPLVRLLREMTTEIDVIAEGAPVPAHDFHCPLLSLPLLLGTSRENIPFTKPYLAAPPVQLALWQARLGDRRLPRIGVMWQGNLQNRPLRNRSLSVMALAPLFSGAFEFHAIGKDIQAEDLDFLRRFPNFTAHTERIEDFADTAALIAGLDLVITIDTSVAHLAAALGKPTWVMLPLSADWRWGEHDACSPWYPGTTCLFRQRTTGDWEAVVASVIQALTEYAGVSGWSVSGPGA